MKEANTCYTAHIIILRQATCYTAHIIILRQAKKQGSLWIWLENAKKTEGQSNYAPVKQTKHQGCDDYLSSS